MVEIGTYRKRNGKEMEYKMIVSKQANLAYIIVVYVDEILNSSLFIQTGERFMILRISISVFATRFQYTRDATSAYERKCKPSQKRP